MCFNQLSINDKSKQKNTREIRLGPRTNGLLEYGVNHFAWFAYQPLKHNDNHVYKVSNCIPSVG